MKNLPYAARVICAASLSNALEFYDFLIYVFFAVTLSQVFFPPGNPSVSLFLAIGSSTVSFISRPIGAIFLGAYADKHGRKSALTVSITLAASSSLAIGLMPGYAVIGVAAPLLVVAARLVQGFAVGGEFGSSTALLIESTTNRKAFFASWQYASQGLTTVFAALVGTGITTFLSSEQILAWGWRIPFLIGVSVAPVGLFIRTRLKESPEFLREQAVRKGAENRANLDRSAAKVIVSIGLVALATSVGQVMVSYMPVYAVQQLHLPPLFAFSTLVLNGGVQFFVCPMIGAFADRVGAAKVALTAAMFSLIFIIPTYWYLNARASFATLLIVLLGTGILKAAYAGALPVIMGEFFPTSVRSRGLSISYAIGVTLFGGFGTLLVTWGIHFTGDKLFPAYYVFLTCVISLVALLIAYRSRWVRD
jgi:MHS family proline/betaine transporter-like MFS transporter